MENRHSRLLGSLLVYDRSTTSDDKEYFICRGGFSTVFQGVFDTRKVVAVKRFQLSQISETKIKEEAYILLKLSGHPNMLRYYGTEKNSDFFYIATELCKGTLDDFVTQDINRYLRIQFGRNILHQLTRALAYLHGKNIVHRDIKPSNILIAQDYGFLGPPKIKLGDFGLSVILSHIEEDFENIHKVDPEWGTTGWMAPELYISDLCNSKMDIFSLGLVFAYTLSRHRNHPFSITGNDDGQANIKAQREMVFENHHLEEPYGDGTVFALIGEMLSINSAVRPTVNQVLGGAFFRNL